jgi:hypothetical protein
VVEPDHLDGPADQRVIDGVVLGGQAVAVLGGRDDYNQGAGGVEDSLGEEAVRAVGKASQSGQRDVGVLGEVGTSGDQDHLLGWPTAPVSPSRPWRPMH